MGSGNSQLSGIDVDEKPVHVTDCWTHYSATVNAENSSLSIFIGPVLNDDLGKLENDLLKKSAKNLMLYRHPCILKFVGTWSKHGRVHLATESAVPLALGDQTALQACIGLHRVLRALVFLHQTAQASHNNVCSASIYVSADGTWKLGGLEYLCRFSDLTTKYLQEIKGHRCEKNIAPEENTKSFSPSELPTSIDQYAFGCLAEELLVDKTGDIPGLAEFKELCKKQLQHANPSERPQLSSVLSHPLFGHGFIRIHSFLEELPLKSREEKECFFQSVVDELRCFPEELVGAQLGALLLARLVLLDTTAQRRLLPLVLRPNTEAQQGLFSLETYRKYVVPRLLQMFCVRDAQVRMLLLEYFPQFCQVFLDDELKDRVLPELLVGVKDTNDCLVSMTLRALAELVPRLGAARVVGGKRAKLFTDGRPKVPTAAMPVSKAVKSPSREKCAVPSSKPDTDSAASYETLPERPSPDGGEDHSTTDEEVEAWSDWDNEVAGDDAQQLQPPNTRPATLTDISTLDIKNCAVVSGDREVDFFQDMEPVISRTKVLRVVDASTRSKFEVSVAGEEDGWGDELDDWGELEGDPKEG
ncbi:protein-associating with the carboxyl-terminal domain of ezrin [Bacillus rossius redtenbacheri]|uniref:protein-associating with the carboxyl-terminal domain of ezrin n=1 Tax=Bacillus rossius redtenbacheri TaxID=93214 RepID=UPI002FDDC502